MILFESATKILPKVSAYAVHVIQFPIPMAGGTAVDPGYLAEVYTLFTNGTSANL